ncbi:MAG: VRR-NUC domain-containing protein [Pseudoalteromonas sp.]|uniref:VRR-NUC domain-containing protein n=1 Tax=Pseudoalteromonas sp. TaxID=53249 RepID=UPI001DCE587C|nr:VRR-NUC domain-containing protein [Pseudoalteromonas sp.]
MRRAQPESHIQQAIVQYLRSNGYLVAHVPNGGKMPGNERQRKSRGARLKREGLLAGFPDLIIYGSDGRVGHIEVKADSGEQTPSQKEVQAMLEKLGQSYAICRSVDDVKETLEQWRW